MSYSFDKAEQLITYLERHIQVHTSDKELLYLIGKIGHFVVAVHDANHQSKDRINHNALVRRIANDIELQLDKIQQHKSPTK